jgi:hypothetical protein
MLWEGIAAVFNKIRLSDDQIVNSLDEIFYGTKFKLHPLKTSVSPIA